MVFKVKVRGSIDAPASEANLVASVWLSLPMDDDELDTQIKGITGTEKKQGIVIEELICSSIRGIEEQVLDQARVDGPGDQIKSMLFIMNRIAAKIEDVTTRDDFNESAFWYLKETLGMSFEDALQYAPDVIIFNGSRGEFAREFTESAHLIPDFLRIYIDWDTMGRDMELHGEIFKLGNDLYVANPNDF